MERRVSGASRPAPAFVPTASLTASKRIILGLDPSLRGTGFGIIRWANPVPETLAQGTIRCPAGLPLSLCLVRIAEGLRDAIRIHHPEICAMEGIFYAQNIQTALIMGQARGAAMAVVAEAGLEIYEMAPRKVKQAIVGHGGAQKLAVARMVQRMLRLAGLPEPDAADALALALAYLHQGERLSLLRPRKL